jgi:hypothetical protein
MNWLRLVERYPNISVANAAVIMGVPEHRAKREMENARRIIKKPFVQRVAGAHTVACRQVQLLEVTVKVSDACPSKEATRLWARANGATVKANAGILNCQLPQAAIDKLPSMRMMALRDSLNSPQSDTPKDLDQDPNWQRKLGKLLTDHGVVGGVVVPGDHPSSGSRKGTV